MTTTEWPEATPNQFFVHVATNIESTNNEGHRISIAGYPTEPTKVDLKTAGLIKTEKYWIVNLAGDVVSEGVWA
jgi:hypothetical protein